MHAHVPLFHIQHPEYNLVSKANDIALVRLNTPANSSPMRFATNTSEDFTGETCTIAGWGRTHCKQRHQNKKV